MTEFLNTPEDCQWLRETALYGYSVSPFAAFQFEGNADCPLKITLYAEQEPKYDTPPHRVLVLVDSRFNNLSHYEDEK